MFSVFNYKVFNSLGLYFRKKLLTHVIQKTLITDFLRKKNN